MTVVDQQRPWLMPSRTLAKTTQPQEGAKIINNGTGSPASQPVTKIPLRPIRSPRRPAKRFASAFTTPKLMMKESTAVVDARPNTWWPSSGTMLRSRPTIAPTKALTITSSVNCCQLARRPSCTTDTSLKKGNVSNWAEKRGKKGKKAKETKPLAEALPSGGCFLIEGRGGASS